MPIVNSQSGTRIDEIENGIYRISTPIEAPAVPGGFTFNQFLVDDDEPLLVHTGLRGMFPLLRQAVESVLPLERLRWVAFGHVEADECGALTDLLAAAPAARPLCGVLQHMLSVPDMTDRAARVLADGESQSLGARSVTWMDAAHVPHGWDNGYLFESTTRTLFGGDLFTQGGADHAPVTEDDILGPSEAMREAMDYYAHGPTTRPVIERLAGCEPRLVACMHGTSYRGDGSAILRELARTLVP